MNFNGGFIKDTLYNTVTEVSNKLASHTNKDTVGLGDVTKN